MPDAGVTLLKERVKEEFHLAGRFYESFSQMVGDLLVVRKVPDHTAMQSLAGDSHQKCGHWGGFSGRVTEALHQLCSP